MKRKILLLIFILASCSPVTKVLSKKDISNVDFSKIKNGTISIYSTGLIASIDRNSISKFPAQRVTIRAYAKLAFEKIIPTATAIIDSVPLPPSYEGKLSMNTKKEMELFLEKHKTDFLFIVTNYSNDDQTTVTHFFNGAQSFSTSQVQNKVKISIELWDIKSKTLVLDYEVYQEGSANTMTSIFDAVRYIDNEGRVKQ